MLKKLCKLPECCPEHSQVLQGNKKQQETKNKNRRGKIVVGNHGNTNLISMTTFEFK